MWAKVYEVSGVSVNGLSGATIKIWQDGSNFRLDVENDPNHNGSYDRDTTINADGEPFSLVRFEAISDHEPFYYKPGNQPGVIFVTPEGVAIVTE